MTWEGLAPYSIIHFDMYFPCTGGLGYVSDDKFNNNNIIIPPQKWIMAYKMTLISDLVVATNLLA